MVSVSKRSLRQNNQVADLDAVLAAIESCDWPLSVCKAVQDAARAAAESGQTRQGVVRAEDGVAYQFTVEFTTDTQGMHSLSIQVNPLPVDIKKDPITLDPELSWYCDLVRSLDTVAYVADTSGQLLACSPECDAYLQNTNKAEYTFRLGVLADADTIVTTTGEFRCLPQTLNFDGYACSVSTCKLPLRDAQGTVLAILSVSAPVDSLSESVGGERMRTVLEGCWDHLTSDSLTNMQTILRELRLASGALCAVYERGLSGDTLISQRDVDEILPDFSILMDGAGQLPSSLAASNGLMILRDVVLPQVLTEGIQGVQGPFLYCARRVQADRDKKGAIGLVFDNHKTPTHHEVNLLRETEVALALEERRYEKALRDQVLYAICEAGASCKTIAGLMAVVHSHLECTIRVPNLYLALYDVEDNAVSFPYYVESNLAVPDMNANLCRSSDRGITEYVIEKGDQVVLTDPEIRKLAGEGVIKARGRVPRIYIGTPLVEDGQPYGVVAIQSYTSEKAYSADDAAFMRTVAIQLGASVSHRLRVRALEESEARYRLYAEGTSDIVWSCTPEGILTFVAPSVERILGYIPKELVGTSVFEIISPSSRDTANAAVSALLLSPTNRELTLELALQTKTGREAMMEAKVSVYRASDGEAKSVMGIARDITPRREYERQFRISSKMESLGQLAGGIAHHYNNLLTVINGYSQFLLSSMPGDDPQREDVLAILNAGMRAAELTGQLLEFGRQRVLSVRRIDLNHEMERARQFVGSVLDERIELVLDLAGEPLPVLIDVAQLQQAVVSLAVNARDAMPNGGKLNLSLHRVESSDLPDALCDKATGTRAFARLSVSDTGVGMTPEVMEHMFEPFFTTKDIGEGTGLGLATVYAIITQADGYIEAHSESGKGTTFDVYLPLVSDVLTAPVKPTPTISQVDSLQEGEQRTVLLVEDESDVRILATRMLERLGCRVIAAEDAEMALELAPVSGKIDVLLTDVVLPGLSSASLYERLVRDMPGLPVIYMSGYGDNSAVAQQVIAQGAYFVSKPFTPSALATALESVLN